MTIASVGESVVGAAAAVDGAGVGAGFAEALLVAAGFVAEDVRVAGRLRGVWAMVATAIVASKNKIRGLTRFIKGSF